jgi:ankyrin repeat protein
VNAKVQGNTPLFQACYKGDYNTIILLLNSGADPTILCEGKKRFKYSNRILSSLPSHNPKKENTSVLHRLSLAHTYAKGMEPDELHTVFSLLIKAGVNVQQRDSMEMTPLHNAVANPVMVRLLLEAGADANATTNDGATPLHLAKDWDSICLLVEVGKANLNIQMKKNGFTPLHSIAGGYDTDTFIMFLEYGPDCNITNKDGNGALHTALLSSSCTHISINALLKAGADPNLKNRSRETPLHFLTSHHNNGDKIMDLLLGAGADIDARDRNGATLLFRKVSMRQYGRNEAHSDLRSLLNYGASANVRDFKGRTVLHEAVRNCNTTTLPFGRQDNSRIEFLLDLGLDPKAVDYSGNNLLHELALRQDNHKFPIDGTCLGTWKQLFALGLDPDHYNHGGRTPLHILVANRPDTFHMSMKVLMPIDYVISVSKNINASDYDGITPLHLASTVSEFYVKKLLDAGADPTRPTHEGLTPLHLAVRSRQSNIVGLLLDALQLWNQASNLRPNNSANSEAFSISRTTWTHGKSDQPPPGIDALDDGGLTALVYACRSGRPETVALLLQAGANVNIAFPLEACAQFEEEEDIWSQNWHRWAAGQYKFGNGDGGGSGGLKLKDLTRPILGSDINYRHTLQSSLNKNTSRLEEILDMLVNKGADMSHFGKKWSKLWNSSTRFSGKQHYTEGWLVKARNQIPETAEQGDMTTIPKLFAEQLSNHRRLATAQALQEFEHIRRGEGNLDLVQSILLQREYDMMEKLFDLGVDFLITDSHQQNSNLGIFIQHGFASLVDQIGVLECAVKFKAGICHAAGDSTRPGLGFFVAKKPENDKYTDYLSTPYLLQAVSRELPNIDVIRLLVEKFGIDVNEANYQKTFDGGYNYESGPQDNPLLSLAKGRYWWHVALALPYLIDHSADLEIRNNFGQTPLHIALHGIGGPFHRDAARILIKAGADVNAVDSDGKSCLAYAGNDIEMIRLLIENRANVNVDALFSSIEIRQVESLAMILSAGVDANMRRESKDKTLTTLPKSNRCIIPSYHNYDGMNTDEWFPIHYAAIKAKEIPGNGSAEYWQDMKRAAIGIVEALLAHGADPYAKFRKELMLESGINDLFKADNFNEDEDITPIEPVPEEIPIAYEECTVLHEILINGGLVEPFLKLPCIDVNRRDAKGQTLLLAACQSSYGPDAPLDAVFQHSSDVKERSTTSLFDCLVSIGADLEARDNRGRNALHHMLEWRSAHLLHGKTFINSLKYLIKLHPVLMDQRDYDGKTPLYVAIVYATQNINISAAEALLDAGADPFIADNNGNTILHVLLQSLSTEETHKFLQRLINCGLDLNTRNVRGETPWFVLFTRNYPFTNKLYNPNQKLDEMDELDKGFLENLVSILETASPNFHARDNRGRSLLHVAANGRATRFKWLMDKGVDPMLEDKNRQTALDIAAACGNIPVRSLFERK